MISLIALNARACRILWNTSSQKRIGSGLNKKKQPEDSQKYWPFNSFPLSEMNYKEQDEEARRYWDAGIRMEE